MARGRLEDGRQGGLYLFNTVDKDGDPVTGVGFAGVRSQREGVFITKPANGQVAGTGSNILIQCFAYPPFQAVVDGVQFFRGAEIIGIARAPQPNGAYEFTDVDVPAGDLEYRCFAGFSDGSDATSDTVTVHVRDALTGQIVVEDGDETTPAEIRFESKCPGRNCTVSVDVETSDEPFPPGGGGGGAELVDRVTIVTGRWDDAEVVAQRFGERINARGDVQSGNGADNGDPYEGVRIFAAGGPESRPSKYVRLSNLTIT